MNYHIFEVINGWAGRDDTVDDIMEFAATWLIYLVFAAGAGLGGHALRRHRIRPLVLIAVTLAVAFAAATVLSHLSHQLRPFQTHHVVQLIAHDNGVSLPSDHATAAFATAAAVAVFLHRGWGAALATAALAIGVARVWAGVHYPGDIAAAALIGAVATALVWSAERLLRQRAGTPPQVAADTTHP